MVGGWLFRLEGVDAYFLSVVCEGGTGMGLRIRYRVFVICTEYSERWGDMG